MIKKKITKCSGVATGKNTGSNMEKAINRCKELIKNEHKEWIGISNQVAIKTVLKALEDYREDYNYRCQLAIDRKKQLENSVSKDKVKKILNEYGHKESNYYNTTKFYQELTKLLEE